MARQGAWTDQQMLHALNMRDAGLTMAQIGKALQRPRNSIIGALHRIDTETNKHDPDGNQNGTMPAMWWKAGLKERDRLRAILGLPAQEDGK
jgi:hypothetical protein